MNEAINITVDMQERMKILTSLVQMNNKCLEEVEKPSDLPFPIQNEDGLSNVEIKLQNQKNQEILVDITVITCILIALFVCLVPILGS